MNIGATGAGGWCRGRTCSAAVLGGHMQHAWWDAQPERLCRACFRSADGWHLAGSCSYRLDGLCWCCWRVCQPPAGAAVGDALTAGLGPPAAACGSWQACREGGRQDNIQLAAQGAAAAAAAAARAGGGGRDAQWRLGGHTSSCRSKDQAAAAAAAGLTLSCGPWIRC
jgi:hypothetical protein